MKKIGLISFAVFLITTGQATGEVWWPPESAAIVPQNPTSSDAAAITLSGEWPNSCTPNGSAISVSGNNIYFDVFWNYPPGIACLDYIAPWAQAQSVGPLSPGTYKVYTRLLGYPSALPTYILIMEFIVTEGRYSGGTGNPNDPYRIATPEDLSDIGNHKDDWNKHFILVSDVNIAEYTGTQFNIIGNYTTMFTGVFDGNDHKIWNFTWASTGRNYIGLFSWVGEGGQIKNIGMENVDVNAGTGDFIGGLVGWNYAGTISDCYSSGSVLGNESVGVLAGYNNDTITNCYSTGSVTGGGWCVGGLTGNNWGTINNCYFTGSVSGNYGVGGVVGGNCLTETITNCYSSGSVSGYMYVGGFVGLNSGTITNCYSSSSVSGNNNVGGLVGLGDPNLVTVSFWDKDTSGRTTSAGGEAKTTAEMKTMNTFTDAGWDFVEIWGIGENQTYPFLLTEPAGDSNHDRKVNFIDLAILASHWLEGIPY